MGLAWARAPNGEYEARAREGIYRVVARGSEWCLDKPHPVRGRIGGFSTPAEAMAWGEDLHLAATGPAVRTAQPTWPTVDEFARVVDVQPTVLRSWIAVHVGGSTSPRRRLDPATQKRILRFYRDYVVR